MKLNCFKSNENFCLSFDDFKDNLVQHAVSSLCFTLSDDNRHVRVTQCDANNPRHKWIWKRKPLNETNKA